MRGCRSPSAGRSSHSPPAAQYNGHSISGWYFPTEQPKAVALINSSNRGTKAEALDHAAMLLDCSCSVLLYDYQGFGDSEGLADVRTLIGDARGVLDLGAANATACPATRTCNPQPRMHPHSEHCPHRQPGRADSACAASGPCAAARPRPCSRRRRRTLPRPAAQFRPARGGVAEVACSQVPDDLNTEKHIQSVTCPTLFVHGRNDDISTVEDAAYLASRARSTQTFGC